MLEIGPGSEPFPVSPAANVRYADKRVGGRDETWPELVGTPRGPQTQFEVDLDRTGLDQFADQSFDVVIASHLIEHVADPVRSIVELHRVARVGGRVVLAVPDRETTFDRVRPPTPAHHVIDEFDAGITEVSDHHIAEFCEAIWVQPPFHPEPVRSWHDPARLGPDLFALHRRRSIHVHCWTGDEFVSLLTTLAAADIVTFRLVHAWMREDEDSRSDEFGLVLERIDGHPQAPADLLDAWCDAVLDGAPRDVARLVDLGSALDRDLPHEFADLADRPRDALRSAVARLREDSESSTHLRAELDRVLSSPSHRIGRAVTTPARVLRDWRTP